MGNRLGSPRKRKRASPEAAVTTSPEVDATTASPQPTLQENGARRPTSPSLRTVERGTTGVPPAEPDSTPRTPRDQHPWQLVPTALQVIDAFAQPVREEQERLRQRRERLVLVNGDPELFFAVHSIHDQAELTPQDAGLCYSHALVLKARGDIAAATQQLRLLATTDTSLATDAQVHLAQCLLLQDPTLETHGGDIQKLLVESMSSDHVKTLDPDLRSVATELLAHVLMAHGASHDAHEMLSRCATGLPASPPVDLLFAIASCKHQIMDSASFPSPSPLDELLWALVPSHDDIQDASALSLMRAEAGAIRTGPHM